MAKRRRTTPQRTHVYQGGRPGFSRRSEPKPVKSGVPTTWIVAGVGVVAVLVILAFGLGFIGGPQASPSPSPRPTFDLSLVHPPAATPLASPLAAPTGDGTKATITTALGVIVMEIYTESAPVAAENFINLAEAGFYNGVGFHRIIPNFMIQGGDPEGTGGGGPGYTIADEPIIGDYTRGMVAMARNSQPHSEGSQFFIMVKDTPSLNGGGYAIFGRVLSGMEVVDQIVSGQTTGPQNDLAVTPVLMQTVTIQKP